MKKRSLKPYFTLKQAARFFGVSRQRITAIKNNDNIKPASRLYPYRLISGQDYIQPSPKKVYLTEKGMLKIKARLELFRESF